MSEQERKICPKCGERVLEGRCTNLKCNYGREKENGDVEKVNKEDTTKQENITSDEKHIPSLNLMCDDKIKSDNEVDVDIKGNRFEEKKEPEIVKRKIKDSVFTNLFKDKKYLLQLYQALHPEDTTATEADLEYITIENILVDALYNDLGFAVRDRLFILAEAQSTWSENIVIRAFLYLAKTYQNYFDNTKQSLFRPEKVKMPKAELYVIYTGDRKNVPKEISMAKSYFEGEKENFVDVKVKLFSSCDGDSIIHQYIIFTKVYDEQRKQYGRTEKAIRETIRICKDRNILKEYFESKEREVVDIMMTLYNEEQIMKTYKEDIERIARQAGLEEGILRGKEAGLEEGILRGKEAGLEEGILRGKEAGLEEGILKGKEEGILNTIEILLETGIDKEDIMEKVTKKYNITNESFKEYYKKAMGRVS